MMRTQWRHGCVRTCLILRVNFRFCRHAVSFFNMHGCPEVSKPGILVRIVPPIQFVHAMCNVTATCAHNVTVTMGAPAADTCSRCFPRVRLASTQD